MEPEGSLPVNILRQINLVQATSSYFWRSPLMLSFHLRLGFASGFFSPRFLDPNPLHHTCHMSFPSHSSWFDPPNNFWWGLERVVCLGRVLSVGMCTSFEVTCCLHLKDKGIEAEVSSKNVGICTRLNGVTCWKLPHWESCDVLVVRKVYAPTGRIALKFEMFRAGVHISVQLNFLQWHLVFVGRQYGSGLIPPFWFRVRERAKCGPQKK